uniref:Myb/SANT-like domain-containing protein n=1 Tax=Setaria viridis TaxID=4556 RepID=A0A4U6VSI0_SETVI|nr:hypothetical protein SEVIR_2G136200v2 [Setaria viridis]
MYTQWKTLNLRSTGLGRDPVTGCIVADDEWWEEQNMAMPGCLRFRTAPLEYEDQMRIMFESVIVTNETSYVPSGDGNIDVDEHDVVDVEGNNDREAHKAPSSSERRASKRPAPSSPKGKKKTFRDQCMKQLVDAYELKAQSNEIGSMLEQVINDRAEEGSDEHFYATQLLQKKENRDVFITLKTPNGRLNWLRRAWEIRKKH